MHLALRKKHILRNFNVLNIKEAIKTRIRDSYNFNVHIIM